MATLKLMCVLAHPDDESLGTGGTGDIAINPLNKYQIFQADLNVKF